MPFNICDLSKSFFSPIFERNLPPIWANYYSRPYQVVLKIFALKGDLPAACGWQQDLIENNGQFSYHASKCEDQMRLQEAEDTESWE